MQIIKQSSVFLPNKPGELARLIDAIARAKVNLLALTVVDSQEHGVIRIVTENIDMLREVLKGLNLHVTETEVLLADLSNKPGALAQVVGLLAEAKVNINYAYVTSGAPGGRTNGILKVNDLRTAMKVLEKHKNIGEASARGTVRKSNRAKP